MRTDHPRRHAGARGGVTRDAPREIATRFARWMLSLALVLTALLALLVFVCARSVWVRDAQTTWMPVFPPILVVAISLLGSIWALRREHLLLTTGLALVSAGLASIMTFIVSFGVGMIATVTPISQTWVNSISAVATACFVLCVLTVIACVVALVRQRLRPAAWS